MDNQKYTIEKSSVELYKLRHPSGMYWADITIDPGKESGRIQIASDYGSWQNYWSHCGTSFKEFLCKISRDYAANKFGTNDYFDAEHNIKIIKKYVLELRRGEDLSMSEARDIYAEIIQIEEECTNDSVHFHALVNNTKHLFAFYYDGFDLVKTITPQFCAFWKNVWPVFTDALRAEISETIK